MIRFAVLERSKAAGARLDEIDGCRMSSSEVSARVPGVELIDPVELARRLNRGEHADCRFAAFDDIGAVGRECGEDGDGPLDDAAVVRLAILWFADEIGRRIGSEHDLEEWPEWMFTRHIPGECPRPLPAIMELYLENDPAICAEFRVRVTARVRRLQSQHARP